MLHKLPFVTRHFFLAVCILTAIGVLWGPKGAAMRATEITPLVQEGSVNAAELQPDALLPSLASLTAAADLPMPPSPSPTPKVTLTVPPEGLIGEDFKFTVTFENPQSGSVGFGPAVDLVLDTGGADQNTLSGPCDGITIVSAEMIGVNGGPVSITPQTAAAPCGSAGPLNHPFGGSPFGPVAVPASARMTTLSPPFGSFQSTQPKITIEVTAHIHNFADLGKPLFIYARGLYQFGSDPLNNTTPDPPIFSDPGLTASTWNEQAAITPVLITAGKKYIGAEQETATGPNYPHDYEITVDVASGQTASGLSVKDCLSSNMQFVALNTGAAATTPGYTVITTPSSTQPCLELQYPSVVGVPGPDIKVVFTFFIPLNDPNGAILDRNNCANPISTDKVSADAKWIPLDPRDGPLAQSVQTNPVTDTITDKRIAVTKTVAVLPTPPGPLRPGKIVQYALTLNISDYFTVGKIAIKDLLGDGQDLITTGPLKPTLRIDDRRGPPTNVPLVLGGSLIKTWDPVTSCNGVRGGTDIRFQVSQAMQNFTFPLNPRRFGILTGGYAFPPVVNKPATVRIVYHATVRDTFINPQQPGDKYVDKHDPLTNCVTGSGVIFDNDPLTPKPLLAPPSNSPFSCEDDSRTSVALPGDVLVKKIIARNGSTTDPELSHVPPRFTANDTITFSISKTLPAGDYEKLSLQDWLPLPVLTAGGLVLDSAPCSSGLPVAGHICRGPGHTLNVIPTLALNPSDNSFTLNYGTHHETNNLPKTIQLYVTLKLTADPYADGLFLTNEAQECERNTFSFTPICQTAIARFELTEPNLRIRKGVIATSNPFGIFLPAPPVPPGITNVLQFTNTTGSCNLPLGPPCPRIWTPGFVNSTMLSNLNAFNSDLIADANDWVTFAIVVENIGNGLNGAFDVTVKDTQHNGFAPPLLTYNIRAHDGTGAPINLAPAGVFPLMTIFGKELQDPGPTMIDGGALDRFNPTNGRNLAVITYNMQLAGNSVVKIGDCYDNTAELIKYAAVEGGPNFITAGFTPPFTDKARVCITPKLEKSLVATSEPHTTPQTSAGGGTPKLAVGEIARYQLRVQLPEGTGPNFRIADALPAGMKFMNDGSSRLAFISNGAGISHPSIPGSAFNVSGNQSIFPYSPSQQITSGIIVGNNCGDDPTFDLGNIQNNDNDSDLEYIVIEFNALVCNVPGNQSGTTLSDTFSVSIAGNTIATSNPVNAVVAEPKLNLVKTASPASALPGGVVTFNVNVTNSGTADAFDVQITDPMSGTGLSPTGPITFTSSCAAAAPTLNSITGVITVPIFPVGCTVTATLYGTVIVKCGSGSVTNTAFATYTSLPAGGTQAGSSNTTGSVTPAPGGERQYSASGSVMVPLCSSSSSCVSPPPNMVSWWPLDEQNGATTAADIMGGYNGIQFVSGAPGVLNNAAPGKVAGSLMVGNNYVSVPDTPALRLGTSNLTIDAWIYNGEPGLIVGVVDKLDISAKRGYALYIENNRLKFVMGNGAAFTTFASTNQVGLIFGVPAWHHVAVTVDRSFPTNGVILYIDGAQAGIFAPVISSTNNISSSSSLLLGANRLTFPPSNPCVCEFDLDEVEIFNQVVSAGDIKAIYAAGAAGKCRIGSRAASKSINKLAGASISVRGRQVRQ
jgi:large repetitive protein